MRDIIVIGGGASGLAAAITGAENGARVTVLEADERPGRKIALSGSGRCNLSNTAFPEHMYHGSFAETASKMLTEGQEILAGFFRSAGILTRCVGTGIYPMSEEAGAVLSLLLARAEALGIKVRCNTKAVSAKRENGRFTVFTDGWHYDADALIIAAGSKAFTGAPGAYGIAESFGHTVTEPLPALVPLVLRGDIFPKWAGVRARGRVTLLVDGTEEAFSEGQLQLTNYGISGIPVMDISGQAARALFEGKKTEAAVDFLPEMTAEELACVIAERKKTLPEDSRKKLLTGIVPEKAAKIVMQYPFPTEDPDVLAQRLRRMIFEVKETRPAKEAQCMTGGIPFEEVVPESMESRQQSGLYLCGEVLDADGICGGYNLSFAFLSGMTAGRSAARD